MAGGGVSALGSTHMAAYYTCLGSTRPVHDSLHVLSSRWLGVLRAGSVSAPQDEMQWCMSLYIYLLK